MNCTTLETPACHQCSSIEHISIAQCDSATIGPIQPVWRISQSNCRNQSRPGMRPCQCRHGIMRRKKGFCPECHYIQTANQGGPVLFRSSLIAHARPITLPLSTTRRQQFSSLPKLTERGPRCAASFGLSSLGHSILWRSTTVRKGHHYQSLDQRAGGRKVDPAAMSC